MKVLCQINSTMTSRNNTSNKKKKWVRAIIENCRNNIFWKIIVKNARSEASNRTGRLSCTLRTQLMKTTTWNLSSKEMTA